MIFASYTATTIFSTKKGEVLTLPRVSCKLPPGRVMSGAISVGGDPETSVVGGTQGNERKHITCISSRIEESARTLAVLDVDG